MNDRNTDLFFNEDNEEVALITLNDEEGNEVDAALMAVFQIEEVYSDEEFAVLMPLEQDEEALMNGQGEVQLIIKQGFKLWWIILKLRLLIQTFLLMRQCQL